LTSADSNVKKCNLKLEGYWNRQ